MDELKFDRDELLTAIRTNRNAHRAEFDEAIAGYESEAIDRLRDIMDRIKAGKRPNIVISMPVPQDHTKDYDRVIRMLEMAKSQEIELSENEFAQYVQDDWAWKGQFAATSALYNNKMK